MIADYLRESSECKIHAKMLLAMQLGTYLYKEKLFDVYGKVFSNDIATGLSFTVKMNMLYAFVATDYKQYN